MGRPSEAAMMSTTLFLELNSSFLCIIIHHESRPPRVIVEVLPVVHARIFLSKIANNIALVRSPWIYGRWDQNQQRDSVIRANKKGRVTRYWHSHKQCGEVGGDALGEQVENCSGGKQILK